MIQELQNLSKKCRLIREHLLPVVFRYVLNRISGLDMIQCSNVFIVGRQNIKTEGQLRIGMFYVGMMRKGDPTYLNIRGNMLIRSTFNIEKGCRIDIGPNATISLGRGYMNPMCKLVIMHSLFIGDGCAISWDCQFLDEDFHEVIYENSRPKQKGIHIGERVWIANNVTITGGARIPNGTVIASNSLVNKEFDEENTIIGGIPAKVLKRNVRWGGGCTSISEGALYPLASGSGQP